MLPHTGSWEGPPRDTAATAQLAAWHPDPAANTRHSDTAGIYR